MHTVHTTHTHNTPNTTQQNTTQHITTLHSTQHNTTLHITTSQHNLTTQYKTTRDTKRRNTKHNAQQTPAAVPKLQCFGPNIVSFFGLEASQKMSLSRNYFLTSAFCNPISINAAKMCFGFQKCHDVTRCDSINSHTAHTSHDGNSPQDFDFTEFPSFSLFPVLHFEYQIPRWLDENNTISSCFIFHT